MSPRTIVASIVTLLLLSCNNATVDLKNKSYREINIDDVVIHDDSIKVHDIEKPDIIKQTRTRDELIKPLLEEIEKQTKEMLPFDEPRTEFGQQDGSLRGNWLNAYRKKKSFYYFNGDRYGTMFKGKPHVPQVCADFIVDSIDRTAGTWFNSSLKYPTLIVGTINFRQSVIDQSFDPRRVEDLIKYFEKNENDFEFLFNSSDGNLGEKVGNNTVLKKFLKEKNTSIGDIIFIRGRVKWDNYKVEHNHSFFVTSVNEEGFVEKVTGNPIYPVERSLKVEGGRTPLRRVTHIVRLTDKFLENITNKRNNQLP